MDIFDITQRDTGTHHKLRQERVLNAENQLGGLLGAISLGDRIDDL